jgi:DNA processing protein
MHTDLLYQLALGDTPHIGAKQAKSLCEHFESAQDIFRASHSMLQRIDGIGEITARSIKNFRNFQKAEKEIAFIEKYDIQPLYFKDSKYPQRLLNAYDPPILLFYKGNADLNSSKIISVVGTRRMSDYGKAATEKLVKDLSEHDVLIVSGLAYGIDAAAHKAALKSGLHTVGVIGHGLDTLYPPQNTGLAKEMLKQGGLLTEFCSNTKPDKYNFPSRNRIVAGISDATVVIETDARGGSMITADLASGYDRDVFAVPGRITDTKSNGCNFLIKENKAIILTDAKQLAETLGWEEKILKERNQQAELFVELTETEKYLVELIRSKKKIGIDELNMSSGLSASNLASTLLDLELKNMVQSMPGRMYRPAF